MVYQRKKFRKARKLTEELKVAAAERLRKAQLEDKATCGICHDYWEQVDMNGQKNLATLLKRVIEISI